MSDEQADASYDRQLLLAGVKRNAVLTLEEVWRYGRDSFGDADYVSVYGMRPAEWYAAGVRLLGRTAVECTRDALAAAMANDIATIAGSAPTMRAAVVVDPFLGSGNTLHWILRCLPGARGVGFELETAIFELTRRNLAAAASLIEVVNTDCLAGLAALAVASAQPLIVFVAPPWGDALDPATGLDLRRTTPPVGEIIEHLLHHLARSPLLLAVQVYERTIPASLADLRARLDWSLLRIYDLNAAGQNHGILLGSRGWTP